jgi:GNAT superfamily N-acetyltransferase
MMADPARSPFPDGALPSARDELRTRIAAWGHPHAAELREAMADELRRRSGPAAFGTGQRRQRADPDPSAVLLTVLVYDGHEAVATATLRDSDGRCEVGQLFVVPSRRRRGLARRVLAELEEFARAAGIDEIAMNVSEGQGEVLDLCERDGWVQVQPPADHEGWSFARVVDTSRVGASLARAGIV